MNTSAPTPTKPDSEVYYTLKQRVRPRVIKPEELYQIVVEHGVSRPRLPDVAASLAVQDGQKSSITSFWSGNKHDLFRTIFQV